MSPGYVVVWHGRTSVAFFDGNGWTLDAVAAKVYSTFRVAMMRARSLGVDVAQAWT